jgi:hemerythrin-like domain-containing protein
MDALTFLRQDHKSVLGMLEVLDEAPSGSGAEISGLETMVTNLVIAESQHEAIEEQFFWPAVRDALEDGDELADEAIKQEQGSHVSAASRVEQPSHDASTVIGLQG